MYTAAELRRKAGLTYRQIDLWATRGYLRTKDGNPGSGQNRLFLDGEIDVAITMRRLVKAGLPPVLAEQIARAGTPTVELAEGITIEVSV